MEESGKVNISFLKAEENDIKEMAKIEKEFFASYDRAFDELTLSKWFSHNPDMFYAVKDDAGELLAFSIMAPITSDLYQRLRAGQVSDMFDFKEEEVLKAFESDYYYIADICVRNFDNESKYLRVATLLIIEMVKIMYQKAKFVMTTPVTDKGLKMTKTIGFKPVAIDEHNGQKFPICEIIVSDENKKRFDMLIEYSNRLAQR